MAGFAPALVGSCYYRGVFQFAVLPWSLLAAAFAAATGPSCRCQHGFYLWFHLFFKWASNCLLFELTCVQYAALHGLMARKMVASSYIGCRVWCLGSTGHGYMVKPQGNCKVTVAVMAVSIAAD